MADRDERGRLLPGHKVKSPGRPRKPVEERYLAALNAAVSLEDWTAAVRAVLEKAKAGDERAFAVLASYLIGKPTDYVNADLSSGGEALTFEVVWNRADAGLSQDAP